MSRSGSENRKMNHVVQIRLDDDHLAKLDELSEARGCNTAEVLRSLIRRAHNSLPLTQSLARELIAIRMEINGIAARSPSLPTELIHQLKQAVAEVDTTLRHLRS